MRLGGADLELEYALNERLAEEYTNFQLDSAISYRERNIEIAGILNDKGRLVRSSLHLSSQYASYGLFMEGRNLLDSIRQGLPQEYLEEYYRYSRELYDVYETFSKREEHREYIKIYGDSLMMVTGAAASDSESNVSDLEGLHNNLSATQKWTREYSNATYNLALFHENESRTDSAKHYYTLSAISDIRCSNKDQGSMIKLARLCYEDGAYTDAYEYARSTVGDAIDGNMKIRTMRVSEFFKIINDAYLANEAQNKRVLRMSLALICSLLVTVLFLLYYVYRQIRKTRHAKQEIQQANAITSSLNKKLMEQKGTLEKANFVQERYIAHFFELSSIHLNKMESYRHSLRRLMTSGKMDDLNRELKSNEMLENELQEQFTMFDKIFLDLYPTFVEDFNALLEPENRITLKPGELMNTELRIYALMRVGFVDSTKISYFLRCSMSTIYTYRTKSRNRSSLSREAFEAAVMKIGTSSRT